MLEVFDLTPKDRLLVQLLLSQRRLSADAIRRALADAREGLFFSFGEVLVGKGYVGFDELRAILDTYCAGLRLGELAVAQGIITEEQLEVALALQDEREERIGQIFIDLHMTSPSQIDRLLEFQTRCREATPAHSPRAS